MNLLVVNAGSSSLKQRILDESDEVVEERHVSDWDGDPGPMDALLGQADAVAHRVVHDVYVYRLAGEITRMAAALGGVDSIAFTGGVGEHSAPLRSAVCARLGWLGVVLDARSNEAPAEAISAPDAAVGLCVIPSREDLTMAAQARAVLRS